MHWLIIMTHNLMEVYVYNCFIYLGGKRSVWRQYYTEFQRQQHKHRYIIITYFIGYVYCQPAVNSILGLVPASWQWTFWSSDKRLAIDLKV